MPIVGEVGWTPLRTFMDEGHSRSWTAQYLVWQHAVVSTAMFQQYSPKTFLRTVRRTMLRRYFDSRKAAIYIPDDIGKRIDIDQIYAALLKLPKTQLERIERELATIGELANPAGTNAVLRQAVFLGRTEVPRIFELARNHHERSLWTFLHEPELFGRAALDVRIDDIGSGRWHRRLVDQDLKVAHEAAAMELFTAQIRAMYAREGRGRYCAVEYFLRRDPERHCFFAYPEDYACSELAYDHSGKLRRKSRKPTIELICVYRPANGVIEILAPGGREYVDELANIFAATILGVPTPIGQSAVSAFNLDVLKDRSFDFPTNPEDGIEAVIVDELRCKVRAPGKKEVVFKAKSTPFQPQAVHDLLEQVTTDPEIRTMFSVIGANMKMVFTGEDGRPAKKLRFTVALPDACSLKDEPHDQIAKKYLRKWGIAQDGPVAKDPPVRRYA